MVAVGDIRSLKEPIPKMKPVKIIKPNERNVGIYKNSYKLFLDYYINILGKKLF